MSDNRALPHTGERFVPELGGETALEHLHRYLMARELAADRDVLDIACGEGYGSAMLAEAARHVVGVDLSTDAITHAKGKYRSDHLEFKVGSCSEIPLGDRSVDLVVSFETIEHHSRHEEMMSEIKRVLRPDGLLVISSPEKREYTDIPGHKNNFHEAELYREDFESLLSKHFANTRMYGQRVVYASCLFVEGIESGVVNYIQDGDAITASGGLSAPLYLIALASDGVLPTPNSGIFERPFDENTRVKTRSRVQREKRSRPKGWRRFFP